MNMQAIRRAILVAAALPLLAATSRGDDGDPDPAALREIMPVVQLDRRVYDEHQDINIEVRFFESDTLAMAPLAMLASPESGDVEVVPLQKGKQPGMYAGTKSVKVRADDGSHEKGDDILSAAPGEVFSAMVIYAIREPWNPAQGNPPVWNYRYSAEWAVLRDPDTEAGKVVLMEGFALTEDELAPPPGMPPVGTLFVDDEVGPVQVAADEMLVFPRTFEELASFLVRTDGKILGFDGWASPNLPTLNDLPQPGSTWFRVRVEANAEEVADLPVFRTLLGEERALYVSNQATLNILATATALWMDGFQVGLNPRVQLQASMHWPEGEHEGRRVDSFGIIGGDPNPRVIRDPVYGVRDAWAFIEMFDFNSPMARVPVGVIDSGFAPNPDFQTLHPLYRERNLATGASGIGSAWVPQEVGNSLFGGKTWHGNGTVTTISGVGGNGFGAAGVAAQTAVPMLYHMGLGEFATGFGSAIRLAVDDGASVINISAGYPCRILSVLGNDDICTSGGRAAFVTKLGFAVRGAAAAVCAAGGFLDAFLPGLGTLACASAVGAAETAAMATYASLFVGETRGPVENAVAYATSHGVPVVASAGNRLSDEALGPLAPFVNNENTNIDDWLIIPAVIPDVIAVASSDPSDSNVWDGSGQNWRANIHFWGDSVDLWAPYGNWYWAPEPPEINPALVPVSDHVRRNFGATSNSAPYVTGVIANMMAVNRSLDRRHAAPAERHLITGRIRQILLDTAHPAGSAAAPDTAEGRTLFQWNEGTSSFDEIPVPDELEKQLQRRRNLVHPFAAVRRAARDAGFFEYESLGYDTTLWLDSHADAGAPDGVILPRLPNTIVDKLTPGDRDFWYFHETVSAQLTDLDIKVTIPQRESPTGFLVNNRPGVVTDASAEERTLFWTVPQLWARVPFPIVFSGAGRFDSVYKAEITRRLVGLPSPDRFDVPAPGNPSAELATPLENWVEVTPTGGLESRAHQIAEPNLNFHTPADEDWFVVSFPSPPLVVPSTCGTLNPWLTVTAAGSRGDPRIEVYSFQGGEGLLLARGSGELRLDCRDYIGRMPLHIRLVPPTGLYLQYNLRLRWSEPDQGLNDRLERIREAHAGFRELPAYERFFPPRIPGLRGSPGLLPDFLVNPNPAMAQGLAKDGSFLASRLFRIDVPEKATGVPAVMALVASGQTLRMEVVGFDEQVRGIATTSNLGQGAPIPMNDGEMPPPAPEVEALLIALPNLPGGSYLVRLSAHSPGDQILLFLSQALISDDSLPIEGLFGQPVVSSSIIGAAFDPDEPGGLAEILIPERPPGELGIGRGGWVSFETVKGNGYQVEILSDDGVWVPVGDPLLGGNPEWVTVAMPPGVDPARARIRKSGTDDTFAPAHITPAIELRYQSQPGIGHEMFGSTDLRDWKPLDGDAGETMGDGSIFRWLVPLDEDTRFFRVRR